jgi:hypothetical protein
METKTTVVLAEQRKKWIEAQKQVRCSEVLALEDLTKPQMYERKIGRYR